MELEAVWYDGETAVDDPGLAAGEGQAYEPNDVEIRVVIRCPTEKWVEGFETLKQKLVGVVPEYEGN